MESILQNKTIRSTKVRRAILKLFSTKEVPFSAKDILDYLHSNNLAVNKTTVYREINFLKNLNAIREIEFGDGKKRYEATALDHHHHLVCVKCGKIKDVEVDFGLTKNLKMLEKNNEFKIVDHTLELFGLCKKCQF